MRIKSAETRTELNGGPRPSPNDTELLGPAMPEAALPRTLQYHDWGEGGRLSLISLKVAVLHPHPFLDISKDPTRMPAVRHLSTASGTVARGGSIMDTSPAKQRPLLGKFMASTSKA